MTLARRDRRQPTKPRYRNATVIQVRDRTATVRADGGAHLDVQVPNGLWLWPGNRVALARYPQGWVAVGGLAGSNGNGSAGSNGNGQHPR
jgi:hypothetical protein